MTRRNLVQSFSGSHPQYRINLSGIILYPSVIVALLVVRASSRIQFKVTKPIRNSSVPFRSIMSTVSLCYEFTVYHTARPARVIRYVRVFKPIERARIVFRAVIFSLRVQRIRCSACKYPIMALLKDFGREYAKQALCNQCWENFERQIGW